MVILLRIKFYLILLTVFLVPLAFNPYAGDVFSLTKGAVIIFMSAILLFLWAVESILAKKVSIKISWLNILVLVLFASSTLTIIANTPFIAGLLGPTTLTGINNALYGTYANLGNSYFVVSALCILFFVISSSISTEKQFHWILRSLGFSGVLVVLLSVFRYFVGFTSFGNSFDMILQGYNYLNLFYPGLYPSQNFSPIGQYYLMPIFLLITSLLSSIIVFKTNYKNIALQIFDYAVLFILVFGFVITTWKNSFSILFYVMGALSLLVIFFYRKDHEESKRLKHNANQILSIIVLSGVILGAGFLAFRNVNPTTSPLIRIDSTWSVAFSTLGESVKSGFFGAGQENFGTSYLRYRPASDVSNSPSILFETLNAGGNYVLEILNNFGIIGMVAFMFIAYKFFIFFFKRADKDTIEMQIFILVFFSLLITMLVLPLNPTLLFIVFLLFSLLSYLSDPESSSHKDLFITLKNAGGASNSVLFAAKLELKRHSDRNIAPFIFAGTAFLLLLLSIFFTSNLYRSQQIYSEQISQGSLSTNEYLTKLINNTDRAINTFGYADDYYNRGGYLYYQKFYSFYAAFAQKVQDAQEKDKNAKVTPTKDETDTVSKLLNNTGIYIKGAIAVNPVNYENYLYRARINIDLLRSNTAQDVVSTQKSAESDLTTSAILNPQNASIFSLFGDLYFLEGDTTRAISAYNEATKRIPSLNSGDLSETAKDNLRQFSYDVYFKASRIYSRILKDYDSATSVLNLYKSAYGKAGNDIDKSITNELTSIDGLRKTDPAPTTTTLSPTATPTPTVTPTTTTIRTTKKP